MTEISFEEVKSLWQKCTTPVMVYIHSAFCESRCSYCVYRGDINCDRETEKEYFYNYLPRRIREYYPILDTLDLSVLYFGGGTPNHRGDIEHLRPSIEALRPYMNKFKEVVLELHMGYETTEEQIKQLKNWGFTTIILCTQTFDVDMLRKKHRLCGFNNEEYINHIDNISGLCKKYGLYTGMDLMFYPEEEEGAEVLENDMLSFASLENPPDEVTLATNYDTKTEKNFEDIARVYSENLPKEYFCELEPIRAFRETRVIRMYRYPKPNNFYTFTRYLDDQEAFVSDTSCLGIGSFQNIDKDTFSDINGIYTLIERTENLKETKFYLLRKISYWDKVRNIIDFFEDYNHYRNPPRDTVFSFINNPRSITCHENSSDRTIEVRYDNKDNITDFSKRMRDLFIDFSENPEKLEKIQLKPRKEE